MIDQLVETKALNKEIKIRHEIWKQLKVTLEMLWDEIGRVTRINMALIDEVLALRGKIRGLERAEWTVIGQFVNP